MFNMNESNQSENQSTQTEQLSNHGNSNINLNRKTNKKDKIGIWYMLFGEKKCKHCSGRKHKCKCKAKNVTKNAITQSDFDMINMCDKEIAMAAKEPKMCANVANCISPEDRGGCGCHLYFCIDKPKHSNLKHKRLKQQTTEDIRMKTSSGYCPKNINESGSFDNEGPKITIVCEPSDDSVPEKQTKKEKQSDSISTNIDSEGSQSVKIDLFSSHSQTHLYQVQNCELDFQKQAGEVHRKADKVQFKENTTERDLNSEFQPNRESFHEDVKVENEVIPNDPQGLENIIQSVTVKPVVFPNNENHGEKRISFLDTKAVDQDDDEAILREYEAYKKAARIRKSSLRNPGMSVRNSSMTFRHQKHFQLENSVSVILKKLNNIEEKIAELENKGDADNIMMGISCGKRQSHVAIKFKKHGDKDKLKEQTLGSKRLSKEKENVHKLIEVKSHKECVIINSPEIKTVKDKSVVNRLKGLSHNSFEIDAHTLGCNSKMIKCTNPKILIECPKSKPTCRSLKNETCDQWRRISEELKISQPEVTCCAKCSCKTCCCNK